jgi:FkbM family methyltransferase
MQTLLTATDIKTKDHFGINDIVLHGLGKYNDKNFVLKIGACDGVFDDLTWGWISAYSMDCLFIEPIKDRYEDLQKNAKDLRGSILIENCAIHETDGEIEMVIIPKDYLEKETPSGAFCNKALYGMSSVYPPKNGLLKNDHDAKILDEIGIKQKVPCYTLNSVLNKHNISKVDLLSIDTEGHDYIIFRQFNFEKYSPLWFEVEIINLQPEEIEEINNIAKSNGYYTYGDSRDLYGVNYSLINWNE